MTRSTRILAREVLSAMSLLSVLFFASGCGGSGKDEPSYQAFQPLEDVGTILKSYQEKNNKPASKRQDIVSYEPIGPVGFHAIINDQCVVNYGIAMTSEPSQVVLAYEKSVPTAGGYVLLQDGTVKKLTAAEFAAAPKAAAKK